MSLSFTLDVIAAIEKEFVRRRTEVADYKAKGYRRAHRVISRSHIVNEILRGYFKLKPDPRFMVRETKAGPVLKRVGR
jgi:hypothetical protein